MAADLQDYTQGVNVVGGSVSITGTATVIVSGTANVSITGAKTVILGGGTAVLDLVLRDGATGVGAVLWGTTLAVQNVAGSVDRIVVVGISIKGTAGNAMTLEFTAANANHLQKVYLGAFQL